MAARMIGLTCLIRFVCVVSWLHGCRRRLRRRNVQATQTLLTRVPETTPKEFKQAVSAASEAYKTWSRSSVLTRQRFVLESVVYIIREPEVSH